MNMNAVEIVKKSNDIMNSDKQVKEFYPYVSEIYVEPLSISLSYKHDLLEYNLDDCTFHLHLTVPFSEFYKEFLKLYKVNHFKNQIMSPVYEFVFEKYKIDIDFLISYYLLRALKKHHIFFNTNNYKVNVYSSDGKEITPIDKVFPK
jgi:hypothetical protein